MLRCQSLAADWRLVSPRFSFIGNPAGRPVHHAPTLTLKQLNFLMQFLHSQEGGAPFRRARPNCLLYWQMAQAPLGGLVISPSLWMQLRVDEKQIRWRWFKTWYRRSSGRAIYFLRPFYVLILLDMDPDHYLKSQNPEWTSDPQNWVCRRENFFPRERKRKLFQERSTTSKIRILESAREFCLTLSLTDQVTGCAEFRTERIRLFIQWAWIRLLHNSTFKSG